MTTIVLYDNQQRLNDHIRNCRKLSIRFWLTPADDHTDKEMWYCVNVKVDDYMRLQRYEKGATA